MPSIPASQLVSVRANVIGAGGSALSLNGVFLTNNLRIPMGTVAQFTSAAAVATYFGASSTEAAAAAIYFNGFTGSNVLPGNLLMATYNTAAVGAFLRGASVASLTLTQLQALSGTLIVTSNGTQFTSATINLATATSFSNAATLIQAGFTSPTFTVSYDAISGGFLFTSTTTGVTSVLSFATGTLSTSLGLTLATGAVVSAGAAIAVPATFMTNFANSTQNWASFTTLFDPDNGSGNTLKQAFAAWNNTQTNRFLYVAWDTDVSPTTTVPATTSLGYILQQNGNSGTACIYGVDYTKAAFICGYVASLDFTQTNGRATAAYKGQSGLTVDVTNVTAASNLIANGYNFYGAYATANQSFQLFQPGSVTGTYLWIDSYVNQIWFTNALQLALMSLLSSIKSIPYNATGYQLVRAACADPIQQALTFGVLSPGVALSALQIAEVNALAGFNVASNLQATGYYLVITPATAQVRAARTSPGLLLLYSDAGSIQKINLAATELQ